MLLTSSCSLRGARVAKARTAPGRIRRMPRLAASILALAGVAGCGGDDADAPGAAPPLGHPFVPTGYAVTVTRVSDDCAVGGLAATAQPATIRWRQDGLVLSGRLAGEGADQALAVQARVCPQAVVDPEAPVDPANFVIHWVASAQDQVVLADDRRCRVEAVTPPSSRVGASPPCSAGNEWRLSSCGGFVGEASVALTFSEGCDQPRTCTLRLRYVGVPTTDHPDAPEAQRLRCSADEIAELGG